MSDDPSRAKDEPATDAPAANTPALRLGVILKIVLPIAVVGGAAVAFFGFFDGAARLTDLMTASLVPVSGQVLFNSQPLPGAAIATQPAAGLAGSIGFSDDQGRFQLVTQVKGEFKPGAYPGEHRVTVKGFHDIPSMGEKPLLTPPEYASFETTTIRIAVSGPQSELKLELTGTPSERPSGPGFVPGSQRPPDGRQLDEPAPAQATQEETKREE